jgi:chorismate synthase
MAGNTIGQLFRVTTFGESHGAAIGVVIDGCPAGIELDFTFIQSELNRRRPGQSHITTQRKESDEFEILSGTFEGKTTGSPIAVIVRNQDYKPSDYDALKNAYRPGHADFTYDAKYGFRDHRGGGRSSARETVARVIAGAIAKQLLTNPKPQTLNPKPITIHAYVSQVGEIKLGKEYNELDLSKVESNIVRCPDEDVAQKMIAKIEEVRKDGDTIGGVITCVVQNVPAGLGEPVFDKLHADLAKAVLSINAAHGFDYGSGFGGAAMHGSINNDVIVPNPEKDNKRSVGVTATNHAGGILGGISNGMDIYFRVAFKPVSTLMQKQKTVDKEGKEITLEGRGRHDPCVLPRAVPIVEAMAAIVLADHYLRNKTSKI